MTPLRDALALGAIAGALLAVAWAFSPMATFIPNAPHYVAASLMVGALGLPFVRHAAGQAILMAASALATAAAGSAVIVAIARDDIPSIIPAAACEWARLDSTWRC